MGGSYCITLGHRPWGPGRNPRKIPGRTPKRGSPVFPSSAPSQARLSEGAEEGNTQKIVNLSTLACDAAHCLSVIAVKSSFRHRRLTLTAPAHFT